MEERKVRKPKFNLYRQRLRRLIRGIQALQEDDEVKIVDLEEYMKLSRRMIQHYISDLGKSKIIMRTGPGKISLNPDYIRLIEDSLGYKPRQLTLDDFLCLMDQADTILRFRDGALSILEKAAIPLIRIPDLREKLIRISPAEIADENLKGDRIILPHLGRKFSISENPAGLAEKGDTDFRYVPKHSPVVCLYLTFLSAASYVSFYKSGKRVKDSDPLYKPDIKKLSESDLPFRNLFTEFPHLRPAGLEIALHYLSEINLYELGIELLEAKGGDVDFYFRSGSLIPHGFLTAKYSRDRTIVRLRRKFWNTFKEFRQIAEDLGITIVGVVKQPRDSWFSRIILRNLQAIEGEWKFHDVFFLSPLMEEGDCTCLIQREERGKPMKDYYEFYLKMEGQITRYEFTMPRGSNDPLNVQTQIAVEAYNLSAPYVQRSHMIPAVVHHANELAAEQLDFLTALVMPAFDYAFDKLQERICNAQIGCSGLS